MALVPKKCGIRVDPPTLIVTYIDGKTGKKRQRSLPLRKFTKQSDIGSTIEGLQSHPKHGTLTQQINRRQLEKLLRVIQERQGGMRLDDALHKIEEDMDVIDPEENLNKLDDSMLKEKKAIMDETFEKNRKKPGDPGFVYEVEIDFEREGPAIESSGWDSEDDSDPIF